MTRPGVPRPEAGAPTESRKGSQEYFSPALWLEERLRAGVRFPVDLSLVTGYLAPGRFAVQQSPARRAEHFVLTLTAIDQESRPAWITYDGLGGTLTVAVDGEVPRVIELRRYRDDARTDGS